MLRTLDIYILTSRDKKTKNLTLFVEASITFNFFLYFQAIFQSAQKHHFGTLKNMSRIMLAVQFVINIWVYKIA